MILQGVITNVTNFGAFVDIGVHQDGLVHISAITNKFIKDPREVVKTGEVVKVKVMQVDATRNRIALTMRLDDEVDRQLKKDANKTAQHKSSNTKNQRKYQNKSQRHNKPKAGQPVTAMAAAFANMKK